VYDLDLDANRSLLVAKIEGDPSTGLTVRVVGSRDGIVFDDWLVFDDDRYVGVVVRPDATYSIRVNDGDQVLAERVVRAPGSGLQHEETITLRTRKRAESEPLEEPVGSTLLLFLRSDPPRAESSSWSGRIVAVGPDGFGLVARIRLLDEAGIDVPFR